MCTLCYFIHKFYHFDSEFSTVTCFCSLIKDLKATKQKITDNRCLFYIDFAKFVGVKKLLEKAGTLSKKLEDF